MRYIRRCLVFAALVAALALVACAPSAKTNKPAINVPTVAPPTRDSLGFYEYTPQQMRAAFGIDKLIAQGYTGKGQTVVVIDSFGSPTLQQDVTDFDKRYNLPPLDLKILSPLGTVPFDASNKEMVSWLGETSLDVEIIHAVAPDAHVVLLTSPVDETEGVAGLPQFLQLEQYAVNNHLGNIVSQSWGASEVSLNNAAGQQEVQQWTSFYQRATTQQGITFIAASGDNGVTDYTDATLQHLSPTPTIGFPADEPWVTAVGGTTIIPHGNNYNQVAWSGSEGGFSAFFPEPAFQQSLSSSVQSQLQNRRGVPDVAAPADPRTGFSFRDFGLWDVAGGTSAAAPFWAGLMAIANQEAGHPLGDVNPALYKLGASGSYTKNYIDITSGNNSVYNKGVSLQGYNAVRGWDPITGLGAPNAANLVPALVSATKQG